ncbi:hypothetical protein K2173_020325 [Erythroxylum novogranatense]|uniref:Uncharacterized protein n=1 Tax=Erythroxylum novogranatense TaxID=1862640 RepID=A0AAV8U8V3_9ROSI|nr:hypothetical protein K2173_020325 [Erythroxylum novogranatense]
MLEIENILEEGGRRKEKKDFLMGPMMEILIISWNMMIQIHNIGFPGYLEKMFYLETFINGSLFILILAIGFIDYFQLFSIYLLNITYCYSSLGVHLLLDFLFISGGGDIYQCLTISKSSSKLKEISCQFDIPIRRSRR